MCNVENVELCQEHYWGKLDKPSKQTKIDIIRLAQAFETAKLSNCVKYSVGCIITNIDNRIVGEGYNGTPEGHENCQDKFSNYIKLSSGLGDGAMSNHIREVMRLSHREWSASHEIHAEMNAIMYSDRSDRLGGTMYVTHQPCENCAKHIAASGVSRVVYAIPYERADTEKTISMFTTSEIEYTHINLRELS